MYTSILTYIHSYIQIQWLHPYPLFIALKCYFNTHDISSYIHAYIPTYINTQALTHTYIHTYIHTSVEIVKEQFQNFFGIFNWNKLKRMLADFSRERKSTLTHFRYGIWNHRKNDILQEWHITYIHVHTYIQLHIICYGHKYKYFYADIHTYIHDIYIHVCKYI